MFICFVFIPMQSYIKFKRAMFNNFQADGRTRGDLFKLRSTWEGIFPSNLLKELDLTVQNIDHNWPTRSKQRQSRNPLDLVCFLR